MQMVKAQAFTRYIVAACAPLKSINNYFKYESIENFIWFSSHCVVFSFTECELFTDDEVHYSIINQSKDTVYISDQVGPPTMILPSVGNFCLLSPEAREDGITGMFDYSDWRIRVSVVRKTVADAHSLEKVIENFMYDTIYVYSFNELKAIGYTIKIKEEDLKKTAEDSK